MIKSFSENTDDKITSAAVNVNPLHQLFQILLLVTFHYFYNNQRLTVYFCTEIL